MDIYELLDITVSLNNRLDTHWTLFITVHLALIGGIIYVDRPLKRSEKIVAVIVYIGFALINAFMMTNLTNLINALNTDIVALKDAACCQKLATMEYMVKLHEMGRFKTTIWSIGVIHFIMFILVVASILNDKARTVASPHSPNNEHDNV
ncbi:hypothetical protein [Alteromonas sp. KUL49]|uniref:hypothetical protein n=1 Tax=Alteromonas sp. KUL49 TaxID=2480798 RepID=UPI00102EFB3F|nr:hypothetical protein [Alteromonas sp. KUL49]TAP34488.1 hypothetical protein EYS00_19265 [Alteromonas sp. KUL49]GEA13538.1 hypothetical protein KUL49_39130 [Alteromonas sp. KUL49]